MWRQYHWTCRGNLERAFDFVCGQEVGISEQRTRAEPDPSEEPEPARATELGKLRKLQAAEERYEGDSVAGESKARGQGQRLPSCDASGVHGRYSCCWEAGQ